MPEVHGQRKSCPERSRMGRTGRIGSNSESFRERASREDPSTKHQFGISGFDNSFVIRLPGRNLGEGWTFGFRHFPTHHQSFRSTINYQPSTISKSLRWNQSPLTYHQSHLRFSTREGTRTPKDFSTRS